MQACNDSEYAEDYHYNKHSKYEQVSILKLAYISNHYCT